MPAAEASVNVEELCGDSSTFDNFLTRVVRESSSTAVMRTTDREMLAKEK